MVKDHDLSTAPDLLDAIFTLARDEGGEYRTIFRGVSDVGHKLVPRALREGTLLCFGDSWCTTDELTGRAQVEGEIRTLAEFCRRVDDSGLRIPARIDGPVLRYFRKLIAGYSATDTWAQWPPEELLPVLGIAQHYGVPTRLLDWSEHPFKAAYFCLSEKVLSRPAEGKVVVWALGGLDLYAFPILWKTAGKSPITLITVPRADNPNLHAQQGVFTLHKTRFDAAGPPDRTPLDTLVANLTNVSFRVSRFTLPQTEAPNLLTLLARFGVSAATMYPGYAGCAQVLRDLQTLGSRVADKGRVDA